MLRAMLPATARPVTKQLVLPNGRALVRVSRRRLATTAEQSTTTTTTTAAPKKRKTFRRLLFYTTAGTASFYAGSALFAFQNQTYYDFFVENVPLGTSVIQFAEEHDWDELTVDSIIDAGAGTADAVKGLVGRFTGDTPPPSKIEGVKKSATAQTNEVILRVKAAKDAAAAKAQGARDTAESVKASATAAVEKAKAAAAHLVTSVEKNEKKVEAAVAHQASQFSSEVQSLITQAEHALAGKPPPDLPAAATNTTEAVAIDDQTFASKGKVYNAPLPVGFEPPPGYAKPAPPKPTPKATVKATPAPPPLPLLAPAVSELAASEPVIAQLAGTIDTLASYLNANPTAAEKARDILDTATVDLRALAERVDKVREEERGKLEASLDSQAAEYNQKLLEIEMEAQDKLDSQEEGFRKYMNEQKAEFVKMYREKLQKELETQSEIINERLKEEVIAQGIELQRRWIREVKIRVEQERGGRLAKLDELAANLKRLERVALENSSYLDENLRVHALWSALRALSHAAVETPVRKPFREELRVLRHFAAAKDDPVASAALDALERSDAPDVGVEPLADLATWFARGVVPRVESVALVPDQDAGLLSHLASHLFSTFRFRREGLVQGDDVLSIIARAEHYLNEKDLDTATRELNQLKGVPRTLVADWLAAARRRLEVEQALEVVQTQATLSSLLVV